MKPLAIALILSMALGACNTVRGVGQDLEATGEAISGSAQTTKEKMR